MLQKKWRKFDKPYLCNASTFLGEILITNTVVQRHFIHQFLWNLLNSSKFYCKFSKPPQIWSEHTWRRAHLCRNRNGTVTETNFLCFVRWLWKEPLIFMQDHYGSRCSKCPPSTFMHALSRWRTDKMARWISLRGNSSQIDCSAVFSCSVFSGLGCSCWYLCSMAPQT